MKLKTPKVVLKLIDNIIINKYGLEIDKVTLLYNK